MSHRIRFRPAARLSWLVASFALLIALPAQAAESVALFLRLNGTLIEGDNTRTSLERENTIECLSFSSTAFTEGRDGTAGRAQYRPITITKRNDRSTPLLLKGLADAEQVEAQFRFYRPSPSGDGTTEHYQTVEIGGGLISSISLASPDVLDPATAQQPAGEYVSFTYDTLTWTYEPNGTSHTVSTRPR